MALYFGNGEKLKVCLNNEVCVVTWKKKITFADASWDEIAEISESGKAAEHFNILDSKIVNLTIEGVEYPFTAKIIGFNHDDLADGSGKAGMSIMFFTTPATFYMYGSTYLNSFAPYMSGYENSQLRTTINSTFNSYLPEDLKNIIKNVIKKYNMYSQSNLYTVNTKLWAPSVSEIVGIDSDNTYRDLGERYVAFESLANYKILDTGGNELKTWLRDTSHSSTNIVYYIEDGQLVPTRPDVGAYLAVGFCV